MEKQRKKYPDSSVFQKTWKNSGILVTDADFLRAGTLSGRFERTPQTAAALYR